MYIDKVYLFDYRRAAFADTFLGSDYFFTTGRVASCRACFGGINRNSRNNIFR